MGFLELMEQNRSDKATGKELIQVKNLLPDRVKRPVPFCMIDDTGNWDYEVLVILAWIRAKRDSADVTRQQIETWINVENARAVAIEVAYFYSTLSKEEVSNLFAPLDISKLTKREETSENPPVPADQSQ